MSKSRFSLEFIGETCFVEMTSFPLTTVLSTLSPLVISSSVHSKYSSFGASCQLITDESASELLGHRYSATRASLYSSWSDGCAKPVPKNRCHMPRRFPN